METIATDRAPHLIIQKIVKQKFKYTDYSIEQGVIKSKDGKYYRILPRRTPLHYIYKPSNIFLQVREEGPRRFSRLDLKNKIKVKTSKIYKNQLFDFVSMPQAHLLV